MLRTTLALAAALLLAALALPAAGQTLGTPSWSADAGTLTLQVGTHYRVPLAPTLEQCQANGYAGESVAPWVRYDRFNVSDNRLRYALPPKEQRWNGLVIINEGGVVELVGTPLAAGSTGTQLGRHCDQASPLGRSLTIVATGSAPAHHHPHAEYYGVPVLHADHDHDDPDLSEYLTTAAAVAAYSPKGHGHSTLADADHQHPVYALSEHAHAALAAAGHLHPTLASRAVLEAFQLTIAQLQQRVNTLDALIYAYDAATCTDNAAAHWDRQQRANYPPPGSARYFTDPRHCCVPEESSITTAAAAWEQCTASEAD